MKIILCILDGWGYSAEVNNNAIRLAALKKNLFWDDLIKKFPNSFLNASGESVGLINDQSGNSEVGHITIGSGRIVKQSLVRINDAIKDGGIKKNQCFVNLISRLHESTGDCHLCGLLSSGGVHSHLDHIIYLAKIISESNIKVKLHLFLDGRDTKPKSALDFVNILNSHIRDNNKIDISTVSGRYYAMDRDTNWDRTELAYNAIMNGSGFIFPDIESGVMQNYSSGITDEFIKPFIIDGYTGVEPKDGLIFANFRRDRAIQLFSAMVDQCCIDKRFVKKIFLEKSLSMMQYSNKINSPVIFHKNKIINVLGEVLSNHSMSQLRIAETEKYNHVTSFFNGGNEMSFEKEKRILVPSKKVPRYDLCPEMSAAEITNNVMSFADQFNLTVINYANPDMVGHTGNMDSAIKAVIAVDKELERLAKYALDNNITLLITADHGNIEQMFDCNLNVSITSHTNNPVHFVIVNKGYRVRNGSLYDIAPSILKLLNIKTPREMTGECLFF